MIVTEAIDNFRQQQLKTGALNGLLTCTIEHFLGDAANLNGMQHVVS
jgi:hypothetical protein